MSCFCYIRSFFCLFLNRTDASFQKKYLTLSNILDIFRHLVCRRSHVSPAAQGNCLYFTLFFTSQKWDGAMRQCSVRECESRARPSVAQTYLNFTRVQLLLMPRHESLHGSAQLPGCCPRETGPLSCEVQRDAAAPGNQRTHQTHRDQSST